MSKITKSHIAQRVLKGGTLNRCPSGPELTYHLICDVLHLHTHSECTVARSGEWWLVYGSMDWLKHDTLTVSELFTRIVPALEQGVNSMRGEIIVAAFAADIGTYDGISWTTIQGGNIPESIQQCLASMDAIQRAVVFRVDSLTAR